MGIRYIGECRICRITCSNMDASLLCHRCWVDPDAARERHAKFVFTNLLLWLVIIGLLVVIGYIGDKFDNHHKAIPVNLEQVDNR